ncbi:MAG: TVP38/TMEM64 family protein [Acidobacteria bacterium]|nr:TVP38/TMEM64 family protein [Acidobacteriota bacterium]
MAQSKNTKALWIALVILGIGVGFLFLPIRQWVLPLQDEIKNLGPIAPVVVVIGYVVLTVLLIPGSLLTLIAGGVFGLWKGLVVVVIGANIGALGSFLLSRTFLQERVLNWAARNPRFASLDRAIAREGFKVVLLSRLSPVFPFTLLNYFLGLTNVGVSSYVLANLIGMLPGSFLYVYLGATARQALAGGSNLIFTLIGLGATIALVMVVTRAARNAMSQIEAESGAPPGLNAS